MICLKFEAPKTEKEEGKPNIVKMFLVESAIGILKKIIPEANPDYDNKIDDVQKMLHIRVRFFRSLVFLCKSSTNSKYFLVFIFYSSEIIFF